LGNAADIPVTEHAADTHGVTLVDFTLSDLLGLQLSPRIRDLGKITLYRRRVVGAGRGLVPAAGGRQSRGV
jgi:TnpA family transposase